MRLARPTILLLALAGCALHPTSPVSVEQTHTDVLGRPAYAAQARQRAHALRDELLVVSQEIQERSALLRESVHLKVAQLPIPARLATRESYLSGLERADVDVYEAAVHAIYQDALAELDMLHAEALERAIGMASSLAPARSPLDPGPTGDALLDREVTALEETLRIELGRTELEGEGYRTTVRRVELLEVFTSFNTPEADETLGGRLLLFVGNDPDEQPRVDVVFRAAEGTSAEQVGLLAAVRHRIMAGDTVAEDLGWSALPTPFGLPAVAVDGRYLLAQAVGPDLEEAMGGLARVTDRRVLTDLQLALFDAETGIRGGADLQLDFRVSVRGKLSWLVSASEPRFNVQCSEVRAVLLPAGGETAAP